MRAGLRYAAGIPAFARPLLMMALVGTLTFEFEVSLPLLAKSTFHGSDATCSLLLGALGLGAIIGGLYAARSARTGVTSLTRVAVAYGVAVALVAVALTIWTAAAACMLARATSLLFLTIGNASS